MNILVVHPAQQHSYRLATALYKEGYLESYITTVYCKTFSFTNLVASCLKGNFRKKAKQRKCLELPDSKVVQFCEIEGLIKLLAMNVKLFRPYYRKIKYHTADRFAKKVVKYAKKHHVDAVISYDDCSSLLFEKLKNEAPNILRIMDVSAANVLYMRQIYEKDMKLKPEYSSQLKREREIVWDQATINRTKKEITNTQLFIVPSSFVSKSLEFSGVLKENIRICPYGVDLSTFDLKEYYDYNHSEQKPIRFVYVGGTKELKGISYLLEAITRIPPEKAQLVVVGNCSFNEEMKNKYKDHVIFTGSVLHSEVAKILKESDVYVFPSLGEGLSLSTLEAASCGLPLIVSENSGVNDAMTDNKEGFVIPIQSADAIEKNMWRFIVNPELIKDMGIAARNMAMNYSWGNYYKSIGKIIIELEYILKK